MAVQNNIVTGGINLGRITLNETDTVRAMLQNVRNILRTALGTVPMYREFGIDARFVDSPINVATPIIYAIIREAIEEFEPRCEVVDIDFVPDVSNPGALLPTVRVRIKGEEEYAIGL